MGKNNGKNNGDSSTDLRELKIVENFDNPIIRKVEREGDDEDSPKRIEAVLIEPGWSKNGFYYGKEVVRQIAEASESRRKVFVDHNFNIFGPPVRSMRDLAGLVVETRIDKDGRAVAVVESAGNPETEWLYELAEREPAEVGFSIDARVKIEEVEEPEDNEGRNRFIVKELVHLNSNDFVTYAAAGGKALRALASEFLNEYDSRLDDVTEQLRNEFKIALEQQGLSKGNQGQGDEGSEPEKTGNPGDSEGSKEAQTDTGADPESTKTKTNHSTMGQNNDGGGTNTGHAVESLTVNQLEDLRPDLIKKLKESFEEESKHASRVSELESEVKDFKAKIETLESEKQDLEKSLDEYKTKEQIRERQSKVDQLIKEAELPEEAVSDIFRKQLVRLESEDEIKQHIEDRKTLVAEAQGEISGNGARADDSPSGSETSSQEGEVDLSNDDSLVQELMNS